MDGLTSWELATAGAVSMSYNRPEGHLQKVYSCPWRCLDTPFPRLRISQLCGIYSNLLLLHLLLDVRHASYNLYQARGSVQCASSHGDLMRTAHSCNGCRPRKT